MISAIVKNILFVDWYRRRIKKSGKNEKDKKRKIPKKQLHRESNPRSPPSITSHVDFCLQLELWKLHQTWFPQNFPSFFLSIKTILRITGWETQDICTSNWLAHSFYCFTFLEVFYPLLTPRLSLDCYVQGPFRTYWYPLNGFDTVQNKNSAQGSVKGDSWA